MSVAQLPSLDGAGAAAQVEGRALFLGTNADCVPKLLKIQLVLYVWGGKFG